MALIGEWPYLKSNTPSSSIPRTTLSSTPRSPESDVLCTLDRHSDAPEVLAFFADRGIRVMTDVELLGELLGGKAAEAHSV